MNTRSLFLTPILLILFLTALPGMAIGQPVIEVKTDKPVYTIGQDAVTTYVQVENPGPQRTVDVHMGIIDPTGDIYEFPDWNTNLKPTIEDFVLPGNFSSPVIELFTQNITQSAPFSDGPGTYLFAIAVMEPGTFNIIGNVAVAYFNVKSASAGLSERFGGVFFGNITDYTGGSMETDVFAAGAFIDKIDEIIDLDVEFPKLDMDTCDIITWQSAGGFFLNLPTFLDAGDPLTMSGKTIPRIQESGVIAYYNESLTAADYVANQTYTFSGPGSAQPGGVGPFSVQVTAPPKINLTQPNLSNTITINRGSALELRWEPRPGNVGDVWVSILATETAFPSFETTNYECQCRFKDDGQAVIPKDILEMLPPSVASPLNPLGGTATMDVFRTNWTTFSATGIDYGFGVISSGVSGNVVLQ